MSDRRTSRVEAVTSVDGFERPDREVVDVAVGVLVERDAQGCEGRFLLTSRPDGKAHIAWMASPD